MVCKFKDGGHLIDYMPKAEIERHRAKSLAKDFGPWKDFYEEMALKTIIRKNFKYLPSSTDTIHAVETSDDTQPEPSRFAPVETSFTEIPHENPTGEIPITAEEAAEAIGHPVIAHAHVDLLQAIYALLARKAEEKDSTADDLLSDITNGKDSVQIDLEEKSVAYLQDLLRTLEAL